MPMTEIASAVGFSSIHYFSKYFKKKEGLSPTEYKKQQAL
jgi:YesN/AraC family two-component response regulator